MTTSEKKVLLVEDNAADVRLLRMALEQTNTACALKVARDGAEALEYIYGPADQLANCPDLILLDLNLPVIGGHDVLKRLKSDDKTRTIPVIVMSCSQSAADIQYAYSLHANSYVAKAGDVDAFFRIVSHLEAFWFQSAILPSCSPEHFSGR